MTMTDLGVECVVGLCMAAAIWWVARRRRTHTEEPKTRFESLEPAKAMALVDDATAADAAHDALLPEGDTSERDEAYDDTTDEHHQQQGRDSFAEEDEEDEAAETDVTDHDVEEEEEEEEDDNEQIEEGEERQDEEEEEEEDEVMDDAMKEAMARAEAMAAKMGVNMTESFMAMEEFLVLDTPPPAMAQSSFEEERMRMEDPASFVHLEAHEEGEEVKGVQAEELDDQAEEEVERVEDNEAEAEAEAEEEEEEEEVKEKEEAPAAGPSLMSAFWAQCEYKDECNLCNTPFSFLVRRHHCRMCRASVCGGCSSNSAALAEFGGSVERVCDRCWASMQMAAADPHHAEDEEDGDDAEEEKALSS